MTGRTAQLPRIKLHQPHHSAGTLGLPVKQVAAAPSATPALRLDRWRAARDRMAAPAATH